MIYEFSKIIKSKNKKNSNISSELNIELSNNDITDKDNLTNNIINNIIINYEKNISINTFNYTFDIKYTKMKSGTEYFTIFNNNVKYSVIIKKDIDEPNEIYLQHLYFFESCAKNKSLLKKSGTIEMLLSILEYINHFYNRELKYFFQDDSSINILGNKLKLNLIYILLYKETWYMKNFNVFCISEEFNINLQIINEYLDANKDTLSKFFRKSFEYNLEINNENNNISENIISEDFIKLISKNNNIITKNKVWQDIKKIYKSSFTSRNFLQLLYKKYGMSIFIILNYYEYYQYISNKLKKILSFECYMQIPNDFINNINVIISK